MTSTAFKTLEASIGDEHLAAAYAGVPIHTWRKWVAGTREPNAAALRLVEILGVLPVVAPAYHGKLLDEARERLGVL